MKNIPEIRWMAVLSLVLFLTACKQPSQKSMHGMKMASQKPARESDSILYYTCPMHHQIHASKRGKCPICGMTLVPVRRSQTDTSGMKGMDMKSMNMKKGIVQITLSPQQQMLAGIRTDTVKQSFLSSQTILTGTTIFDPQKSNVISAWVSGWIEHLYVRNPGVFVQKGQKLYDLYSPELLSAEKDYLLALSQKNLFKKVSVNFQETIQAMRQKLLRWGLSESEINSLSHQKPSGKVTIYSKTSGYLIQKMKEQGAYLNEGDAVMSLAGNATIWVQAQIYDTELPLLQQNPKIRVKLDAFPDKSFSGNIVFDNSVNQNNSRVHSLNIAITNSEGKVQPGMLAYVFLETPTNKPAIVIPKSSVIYDEHHDYVWTMLSKDKFERHSVELGADNNDEIQVLQGIQPGSIVVKSGTYLVNSEYILKFGSGVNMAGMQMSDMKMSGRSK